MLTDYSPAGSPLILHWGESLPWSNTSPKDYRVRFEPWAESGWVGTELSNTNDDAQPASACLACDVSKPGGTRVSLHKAEVHLQLTDEVSTISFALRQGDTWLNAHDFFLPTPAGVIKELSQGMERKRNLVLHRMWPLGKDGRDGHLLAAVYRPRSSRGGYTIELFTDAANTMRLEWQLANDDGEVMDDTTYETHFGLTPCAVITSNQIETEDSGIERTLADEGSFNVCTAYQSSFYFVCVTEWSYGYFLPRRNNSKCEVCVAHVQVPDDEELMFLQRASVYLPDTSEYSALSFILSSDDSTIWYTNCWHSFTLPLHQ